ncbi:hypothetical protein BDR06DRAFT_999836 [Suillus hirtellus]|nr:hypothetical protein BDR06DRAFT_999836 [Suillus hirtellus]
MNAGSRLRTSQVWKKEQRYGEPPAQRTLLPLDVLEYSLVPARVFILFVSSVIFMLPELVMLSQFFHSAHGLRRGAFAIVRDSGTAQAIVPSVSRSSSDKTGDDSASQVMVFAACISKLYKTLSHDGRIQARFQNFKETNDRGTSDSNIHRHKILLAIRSMFRINRLLVMSEDNRPDAPPETCEAPVRENSSQPRCRIKQTIQKSAKGVTKKLSKPFKCFRNRTPANQNADLRDASTTVVQNIEMEASSSQKNEHLTAAQIPSDSVDQGLTGEPASQVQAAPSREEEVPDAQLADAELQGAFDRVHSMGLLGKHASSAASAAGNASADLAAAADFEKTYLQPLKIIDGVLEKIADLHPYAKMALGVLSAASKVCLVSLGVQSPAQKS